MSIHISKKLISFLVFLLILITIPFTLFLLSREQDIRQEAATSADLVVTSFVLTDSGGNEKTVFFENEDIYVKTRIKNQGSSIGESSTGRTISQIYSNSSSSVSFQTPSDVDVSMDKGEFAAGAEFLYESRIRGERQDRFVPNPYDESSSRKYAWRKQAGNYTARILLNSDQAVEETDYANNQAAIQYTVVPFNNSDEVGSVSSSKPSGFDDWPCVTKQALNMSGVSGCIQQIRDSSGTVWGRITNNTGSSITAVIASYKAYHPYVATSCSSVSCPEQWDWAWIQTFYKANTVTLQSGSSIYISTQVPNCAWQADVFANGIPKSCHPNIGTYSGSTRYIDGWYHFYPNYVQSSTQYCEPSILPTPTPTTRPSNTPSPTIPSGTPSPTLTPSPTPTTVPSVTVTPTDVACPVPSQPVNVKIDCPFCGL